MVLGPPVLFGVGVGCDPLRPLGWVVEVVEVVVVPVPGEPWTFGCAAVGTLEAGVTGPTDAGGAETDATVGPDACMPSAPGTRLWETALRSGDPAGAVGGEDTRAGWLAGGRTG